MIDIYKTKSIKDVKDLNRKLEAKLPAKTTAPHTIHKTDQNFTVPDEDDIYISSLNKLKLKEYIFEFFGVGEFIKNLVFGFGILFVLRYLGMLIFGYFWSGSPLYVKFVLGFVPVLGYNTTAEISSQINTISVILTAIMPTIVLIFWSLKGQSLITVPRAFELIFKEVNFLDFGSDIYKDTVRQITKFVPKFFYEFIMAWFVLGFFGILQYVVQYDFSGAVNGNFGSNIWKFVILIFVNIWIVLVWNKKVKQMRLEWDSLIND
jgi:hypothetical protein